MIYIRNILLVKMHKLRALKMIIFYTQKAKKVLIFWK